MARQRGLLPTGKSSERGWRPYVRGTTAIAPLGQKGRRPYSKRPRKRGNLVALAGYSALRRPPNRLHPSVVMQRREQLPAWSLPVPAGDSLKGDEGPRLPSFPFVTTLKESRTKTRAGFLALGGFQPA